MSLLGISSAGLFFGNEGDTEIVYVDAPIGATINEETIDLEVNEETIDVEVNNGN